MPKGKTAKYLSGQLFDALLLLGDGLLVSSWLLTPLPTTQVCLCHGLGRRLQPLLTRRTAGEPTGSPSGPPPPVSSDITSAAKSAAAKDAMGQNVPGQDSQNNDKGQTVMGESGKEKTAKESTQGEPEGPH